MLARGFPCSLSSDATYVESIVHKQAAHIQNSISAHKCSYRLLDENITFPYRIYFANIPDNDLAGLSKRQQQIVHCLYTRSNDGHVREKHVKALLSDPLEEWMIPYIVKVSDEYVVEILIVVFDFLKDKNTENIKTFCQKNVSSFITSFSRMTSYWNAFYRCSWYRFHGYVGYQLFHEIFGYTRSLEKHGAKRKRGG